PTRGASVPDVSAQGGRRPVRVLDGNARDEIGDVVGELLAGGGVGPVGDGVFPHVVSAARVVLDQAGTGSAEVSDVLAEVALAVLEGVDGDDVEAPLRDLVGGGAGVLEGGVVPAHVVGDVLLDVAGPVEGLVHVEEVAAQVVAAGVVVVVG